MASDAPVANWYLLADIGGTHARFAYAAAGKTSPKIIGVYTSEAFPSFAGLLDQLQLDCQRLSLPETGLTQICLAVAAAPVGNEIRLTNNAWCFSLDEVVEQMGCPRIRVVNDFAATARCLPHLGAENRVAVGVGSSLAGHPMVAIGPGTGTGVSSIAFDMQGRAMVLAGEGGHVDFSPTSDLEAAVLQRLRNRYERVSIERILSGPGITNLYHALGEINDQPTPLHSSEAVGAAALTGQEAMAVETMKLFFAVLGSAAGDFALTLGARGGVYIAGGIVPDYIDFMKESEFRARFEAKGRFASFNTSIGTYVITHPHPGLLGAALLCNEAEVE
ncbi:MAG: glucokinase [Luminiphilus sp.]|nr:glucokinase [Luminiphilus sp.]